MGFTSEEEIMQTFKNQSQLTSEIMNTSNRIQYQQPVAVVWDDVGEKQWYIGFIISELSNSVI